MADPCPPEVGLGEEVHWGKDDYERWMFVAGTPDGRRVFWQLAAGGMSIEDIRNRSFRVTPADPDDGYYTSDLGGHAPEKWHTVEECPNGT